MNHKFWQAVFALVGTTIGAGIFGLPYVFARAGFFVGLTEFLIIVAVVLLVQLMIGEVALRTQGRKRLLGFAEKYLNRFWYRLLAVSISLTSIGTLLAYLILAGEFISILVGWNIFLSTVIFFGFWFLALLFKARAFGKTEFYIGLFSIGLIIFIAVINFSNVNFNNLRTFNFQDLLLPYGVILFAITGTSVIPEMEDILGASKGKLRRAIIFGTLIPAITYIIFVITVVGVSGTLTSQDAISGFALVLNSKLIRLAGALVGILAVAGAALSYGIYFKETLWYDLKINKWLAWFLAGGVPFLLFLLDIRNFLKVISFIGAVILGFQLITILLMHKSAKSSELKPAYEFNMQPAFYWALGISITLGAAIEVWYSIWK